MYTKCYLNRKKKKKKKVVLFILIYNKEITKSRVCAQPYTHFVSPHYNLKNQTKKKKSLNEISINVTNSFYCLDCYHENMTQKNGSMNRSNII